MATERAHHVSSVGAAVARPNPQLHLRARAFRARLVQAWLARAGRRRPMRCSRRPLPRAVGAIGDAGSLPLRLTELARVTPPDGILLWQCFA